MKTFPLKLTDEQLETLQRRARAAGLSQQQYAKERIFNGKLNTKKK